MALDVSDIAENKCNNIRILFDRGKKVILLEKGDLLFCSMTYDKVSIKSSISVSCPCFE